MRKKAVAVKPVTAPTKKLAAVKDEELVIPKLHATTSAQTFEPVKDRRAALRALMAKQNESAGHKVLAFASDVPNTFSVRRPSGIMQLDMDTGGGLPAGCMSELSGPNGAGKTFLAMHYLRMHQKIYGEQSFIAYACVEGAFDFRRALNMGLKVAVPDETIDEWNQARTIRSLPEFTKEEHLALKEQIGEFVIIRGNTGEEIMQAVLDSVRSNLFGIVVVDSISALLPDSDAGKDLDENNRKASRASLVTDFVNRYLPTTNGLDGLNYTTLICLNQVRANQERANSPSHLQKYIKDWVSMGASAEKHAKHIDITVTTGQKLKKTIKGEEHVIGKVTNYEIIKGKTGTHENIRGEFPFYYETYHRSGVDHLETVILQGMHHGVIVERNGKISVLQPDTGHPTEIIDIPGIAAFKRMMEIDFDFELAVRREVMAAKGILCLYR